MSDKKGFSKRRATLIFAQLLTLVALCLGLAFMYRTTGATLFLFSVLAPGLSTVAILSLAIAGIVSFRKRHSLFEIEDFQTGQSVFEQGEMGHCAYFIESGEVEIVRTPDGAAPVVLARLGQGNFFGENALLTEGPRNATVRATVPTKLAILGKENFLALCKMVPAARQDILKTARERSSLRETSLTAPIGGD
jgi:hypothetical protein